MASSIDLEVVREDMGAMKPVYQAPVLTELEAEETANGLITGAPENNVTYS